MSLFLGTAAVGTLTPTATDLAFASSDGGLVTSKTFSGQSLGAAHPSRVIACRATIINTTSTRTIGSLTLDGNAMTLVAQDNNVSPATTRLVSGIYYLPYPTGTTGDFVLTVSGVQLTGAWGIKPVAMYNLRQQAPRTSGTDDTGGGSATSLSMSLNRLSGSIQVFTRSGTGGTTYSGTNFTSTTGVISASAHMQNGFDQAQPAGTGITFTSTSTLATFGAFVGAIWR